jgi:4-diphosphocytidyl-2-C-methyl-D-erythritol kinase
LFLRKQEQENTVKVFSPAKINLTLEILGKRPDGYHDLFTIFKTIQLADELTINWISGERRLHCSHSEVPLGEENLILKAVRAIEKEVGFPVPVEIFLEKKIPIGAGLGGGSSNAAAVLRILGEKYHFSEEKLNSLSAELGADVPFFLQGGTAFGRGKGDELEPLPSFPSFPLVLIKPHFSISTAFAYRQIRSYTYGENSLKLSQSLKQGEFQDLFRYFVNDFEPHLFPLYPQLEQIKNLFMENGALAAQVSGSGSALFAVVSDEKHALNLAEKVKDFGEVWVTRT